MGIRRVDKLMNTISSFKTALQLMITEFPAIQRAVLILGPSPLRPIHVYELNFSCDTAASGGHFTRNRVVEALSKKVSSFAYFCCISHICLYLVCMIFGFLFYTGYSGLNIKGCRI